MTAAHVPPQCAGNSMITPEYKLMVKEGVVSVGRNKLGGIHSSDTVLTATPG